MLLPSRPIQRVIWIIARLRDKNDMRMFALRMLQLAQVKRREDLFGVGFSVSVAFASTTPGNLSEVSKCRGIGIVAEERGSGDVCEVAIFEDTEAHGHGRSTRSCRSRAGEVQREEEGRRRKKRCLKKS